MQILDLDSAIASFRKGSASSTSDDVVVTPSWSDDDWRNLFAFTSIYTVGAGEALIRRGVPERTLYFVTRGRLEVVLDTTDRLSMGHLTRVGAGSVLGEQSFFDGQPRSASAWAIEDCDVAAMSPDQFAAFEEAHPGLARALLFALGRILAGRLRRMTERVRG